MYKIKIIHSAQKDLDQLRGRAFYDVRDEILLLASNPRPYGAVKLSNENGYRIRIGDYRALYRIDDKAKEIFIYRVKHRKDAYR